MRRFTRILVATIALGAPVGMIATTTTASASVAAGYRLHIATNGQPYVRELMTLLENHTGYTDLDSITWSRHGRKMTLVFRSRQTGQYEATYSGTLEPTGISSRRHPGTISSSDGAVGFFYAVNKTD